VDAVAQRWIETLRSGATPPTELPVAGGEARERTVRAFVAASAHPDLAPLEAWLPRLLGAAEPALGAETLLQLATQRREQGPPLPPSALPALAAVVGASAVLGRRLAAHPAWIDALADELPAAPPATPIDLSWDAIRHAKYQGLLAIAARDLLGRAFADSLGELSLLADRCLTAAAALTTEETGAPEPALFALGKLGGHELNFSSDVDLLFIYIAADGEVERARDTAAWVRHFKSGLEEPTVDGFGYRIDLDLRPEGRAGVLANPVDAALDYYEGFGAEWERQMLIRLRAVAGPEAPARAFEAGIAPFVYRGLIGPDVMREVRAMKIRIETERRAAGRDLEACLKEGPGGIRDVEFLVQAFQLLDGRRHPKLRTGNVIEALQTLGELELLPPPVVAALEHAYLWLRRAEHALQLAEEQQTSRVPPSDEARTGLARRMGYAETDAKEAHARFLDDWLAVRTEVRAHFDALVLGDDVE
jgi:glutamate-ammonia-ligase adenylyltransferase